MVAAAPRSPRSPNSPNSRATRPKTRGTTAQVSSLGRVRTKSGKIVTPNPAASGYCSFRFNNKSLLVHRIVALLFLGPPERSDQTQVDHIDGDRSNNRAVNLRWASPRENRNNATTRSNRKSNCPKQSKPVKARPVGGTEWSLRFESACDAAKKLGVSQGNIWSCLHERNGRKSTGGYEFEFDEPNEPAQLPGEEWRRHDETGAMVSSLGRVKNARSGVVSRGSKRDDGYVAVGVTIGGRQRTRKMHRLVAEAFGLPRLPGQNEVNHIDGDPSNNRVENLEWASCQENVRHSHRTNPNRGNGGAQTSQGVEALGADGAVVARYPSLTAAAEALGVRSHNSISACLAGRAKTCRGFQFRRVVEEADKEGEVWKDIPEDIVSLLDELR